MDFRPRRWEADGSIRYVASECDVCHRRSARQWWDSLGPEAKARRNDQMRDWWVANRSAKRERLDAILEEAQARAKSLPPIKKPEKWKPDVPPRDLLADSRGDYLWAVHHALKIKQPDPRRSYFPLGTEFDAHSADLECKHGTCPGDTKPQPGCPGYQECIG